MKKIYTCLLSIAAVIALIAVSSYGYTIYHSYSGHFSFSSGDEGHTSSKEKEYEYGYYYVKCEDVSFYGIPSYTNLPKMKLYLRPKTPNGDHDAGYTTTYYPSTVGTGYWKNLKEGYKGLGNYFNLYGWSNINRSATVYYVWQP